MFNYFTYMYFFLNSVIIFHSTSFSFIYKKCFKHYLSFKSAKKISLICNAQKKEESCFSKENHFKQIADLKNKIYIAKNGSKNIPLERTTNTSTGDCFMK